MCADKLGAMEIAELLLTAEIYNREERLTDSDLPPRFQEHYLDTLLMCVRRPIYVTIEDLERIYDLENVRATLKELPFVAYDENGSRVSLATFNEGANWFASRDTYERIQSNPVLAYYYQQYDPNFNYTAARFAGAPGPSERKGIDAKIEALNTGDREAEDLLKLVNITAPERVRNTLDDLVLTDEQREEIAKAGKAMEHREYLREVGLYEIGKFLFVGPPGTGKTSTARALSRWFQLPLLEVKLSMTISHYLGETSRNVDGIFVLAKRLSPCILFVDEFDFVAKTRTSDDHGAIKRAVNTLLKAIDDVSLVEDGVLLIAATNFPQLLDHAAWRRFDKVLSFTLPDTDMRRGILEKVLQKMDADVDPSELSRLTEGFSGSDLRLVVREAVLNALLQDRKKLDQKDLLRAVQEFHRRNSDHREVTVHRLGQISREGKAVTIL